MKDKFPIGSQWRTRGGDRAMKLKVLDLFSGIGGFSLGLERTGGFETVAFCEIDPFCQKVLKKHWPHVPIHNDVRNLNYDGSVDVITGGYPCQPFSTAGKRKGADDDRHLWPAMFSLIKKYRPTWVIGENVDGLVSMGLDSVLADLGSSGYGARTFAIPACAVNAPHRRYRLWIVANSQSAGKRREVGNFCEKDGGSWGTLFQQLVGATESTIPDTQSEQNIGQEQRGIFRHPDAGSIADASNIGCEGGERKEVQGQSREPRKLAGSSTFWDNGWPVSAPRICGVDDGIPQRTHRRKSLGNAVVPQIPEMLGYAILEAERAYQ